MEQSIPSVPPVNFKYEKDVCALSWWRPIRLLQEGSISDIHLCKRRDAFMKVRYKEKRDVMELAKKASFFRSKIATREEDKNENEEDLVVLKSIRKDHIGRKGVLNEMRSEILVLSHLDHPNIVKLYEAYERRRHIYLLMEYCPGGNLTNRTYTEEQARSIVLKVLSAVAYMHSKGVAHRDIKLENITIDRRGDIKMIDFGLATKYLSDEFSNMTDTVGTLYSMAPQVVKGKVYDYKCDLWSTGVVTYLLLSNQQPFWGPMKAMPWVTRREVMKDLIIRCRYAPMEGIHWQGKSEDSKHFVRSLLQYDPNKRPTAAEALNANWFKQEEKETDVKLSRIQTLPPSETIGLQNEENVHITDFRRKALRLLASKLSQGEADALQAILEESDIDGQGSVDIKTFLQLLKTETSLSVEDLTQLAFDDERGKSLEEGSFRLPYIDFMIEVHAGRRRNIVENLAALLDTLDTDESRVVDVGELTPRLDGLEQISETVRDELRTAIIAMQTEDGNVSTVRVLEWFGKRVALEQRTSIRSVSDPPGNQEEL